MSGKIRNFINNLTFRSTSPRKPPEEEKKVTLVISNPVKTSDTVDISGGKSKTESIGYSDSYWKSLSSMSQKDADELSERALLLDEIRYIAKLSAGTTLVLTGIGAVGAVGMTAVSAVGMAKAKNPVDKVDYGTGIAWGVQSGLYIGEQLGKLGKSALTAAKGLGIAGGAVEVGVGIKHLYDGIKTGDKKKKILGLFDIGIGTAWAGSALFLSGPVGSAIFLGLTTAKMAYLGKDKIKAKLSKWFGKTPPKPMENTVNTQRIDIKPLADVNKTILPQAG